MKLRIKGSSIRLRLTQGEVAEFAETGKCEDRTEFGDSSRSFGYAVIADPNAEAVSANFESGRISVFVPREIAEKWAATEQTGISAEQPLPSGKTLRILIEKDFACLTPRAEEDESDNYPHPKSEKSC
jgi:hypothetical protein